MPKVSVYKKDGTEAGSMTLKENVFGAKVNESIMHQVVVAQLANRRQGTQSVLSRSEVRGGGAKPWRQKGTGRARHGTTRSPIWIKGGVTFAMKPRDYSQKVNKKVKKAAIQSALSMKVADKEIIVLEDLKIDAKTKTMANVLKSFEASKALIVTENKDDNVVRASNNLQGVKTCSAQSVNVYDLINYDKLVITKKAVKKVEEVFA
ncbi:MAG: 50S ribosomal protein L4 [Clostridia bacterium]|jgi:large subunit ribosomal protein L4|nr:50S ribosomal protein L4 [Clostridia bacterium]MBT7121761.1 50S ribosomal protein L4 [Clostridia bacterium]